MSVIHHGPFRSHLIVYAIEVICGRLLGPHDMSPVSGVGGGVAGVEFSHVGSESVSHAYVMKPP